jgi:hypothetical protein
MLPAVRYDYYKTRLNRDVRSDAPNPRRQPSGLGDKRRSVGGGRRVRIRLPPAESRVRTRFGPQLRLFLRVRPQRIPLRYNRASIGLHCGKSCTRKSAGHCAGSSPLPVIAADLLHKELGAGGVHLVAEASEPIRMHRASAAACFAPNDDPRNGRAADCPAL